MKLQGTAPRPIDPLKHTPGFHQAIGSKLWLPPTFPAWANEVEKARRWYIPGFIPADSLVLTSGQQKRAMKTFFAMTTALSLATKTPTAVLQPVDRFPILFIEEEGGRSETRERMLGICRTLKIDPFAKNNPLKHFYFSFHNRTKLDSPRWAEELCALVKREQIAYVVLDAMVYMHAGDENKVSDMAPVVDALQGMRYAGATVNFLAHLDKTRGEDKKADPDSQVRGTGLVVNCYDTHLAFRRYKRSDAHIDLYTLHRGYPDKQYKVAWQINSHSEGHGEDEKEILDLVQLSMIEVQDENDVPKIAVNLSKKLEPDKVYSPRELRQTWGVGAKTAKDVIAHMLEAGLLEEEGASFVYLGSEK